eukprot:2355636-Pyramimonas_sp.AAC.2
MGEQRGRKTTDSPLKPARNSEKSNTHNKTINQPGKYDQRKGASLASPFDSASSSGSLPYNSTSSSASESGTGGASACLPTMRISASSMAADKSADPL